MALSIQGITKTVKATPSKSILYAVEGWGKTSFAAQMQDAVFMLTPREDGLIKLIANCQLRETAHFGEVAATWEDVKLGVQSLSLNQHPYRTFVLDVLNGAADLCVKSVTDAKFGGDTVEYNSWARGRAPTLEEWNKFIGYLTNLRDKGMQIMLLCHADVKEFKNPEGENYDKYTPRIPDFMWKPLQEWADMILFGQLETFVKNSKKERNPQGKGKVLNTGAQNRLLYTQRTPVADAKNRHGLPLRVDLGHGPESAWEAFAKALIDGRKRPAEVKAGESKADETHPDDVKPNCEPDSRPASVTASEEQQESAGVFVVG